MSDIGFGKRQGTGPFGAGAIALMLALGIVGFAGLLILGAYAPDLRSGKNGGAHALSNSATGYSAIVALAQATGRHPRITRNEHEFYTDDLLVVTPETPFVNVSPVLQAREALPTLFVLPKWFTKANKEKQGWVDWVELVPLDYPVGVLAPGITFTMKQHRSGGAPLVSEGIPAGIQLRAPRPLQVITGIAEPEPEKSDDAGPEEGQKVKLHLPPPGDGDEPADDDGEDAAEPVQHHIEPLITDGHGGIVLGQIDDKPLFVLADPDLLSNMGMRDVDQAAAMLKLLDWLNDNPPRGIAFDVSLNGFDHSKSPLKLLFEPPFLAMTISVAVALLLAGIQAFGRFGPARARERAVAFGKTALVDNSAALIRKARREGRMGGRYAAVIRERAVAAFGISPRLRDRALDNYLDELKGKRRFTELADDAEQASDRNSLLAAAQALHQWQKEKIG